MHRDFKELFSAFNEGHVKYLVVGGYAVSMHAEPRATKDLDIPVGADSENSKAVYAVRRLKVLPRKTLWIASFACPPVMVDIMPRISGVEFEDAWQRRVIVGYFTTS